MDLELEYICPGTDCGYRGDKESVIRHMPHCAYIYITVKAIDGRYLAEFTHDVGRHLDRLCASAMDRQDIDPILMVFYQRLLWALSGDEDMQREAAHGGGMETA